MKKKKEKREMAKEKKRVAWKLRIKRKGRDGWAKRSEKMILDAAAVPNAEWLAVMVGACVPAFLALLCVLCEQASARACVCKFVTRKMALITILSDFEP